MKRILIVDDEHTNMMLAVKMLEHLGYKAVGAWDGYQAIKMVAEQPFDIILMDINMPTLDGLKTAEKIIEEYNIPIIAVTADSSTIEKGLHKKVGMVDHIFKPYKMEQLKETLDYYLIKES